MTPHRASYAAIWHDSARHLRKQDAYKPRHICAMRNLGSWEL